MYQLKIDGLKKIDIDFNQNNQHKKHSTLKSLQMR